MIYDGYESRWFTSEITPTTKLSLFSTPGHFFILPLSKYPQQEETAVRAQIHLLKGKKSKLIFVSLYIPVFVP